MGKIHVWSNSREEWEAIPLSEEEVKILRQINRLAEKLEKFQHSHPKKHAIYALIKEFSSDPIAPIYVSEKIKLLFT